MFFNKKRKAQAIYYLDKPQENYQDLFHEPMQKSIFTEADIQTIEKELGYKIPKPYIDFLQSYQLPESFTVSVSFCGDYANCYEPEQEDDLFVTLEMEWYTALSGDVRSFLSAVQKEDMPLGGTEDSFLDAGFLKVAEFEGYIVFLDLVTGEVIHIYHEAIYDMSIVDGIDVSDYKAVRVYLSDFVLCKDFYDFLRLVCTKDIYDEDCLKFKTIAEIEAEESNYTQPSIEEQNEIKEKAIEQVMNEQNMSREDAIQYLADLVQITVEDFNRDMK